MRDVRGGVAAGLECGTGSARALDRRPFGVTICSVLHRTTEGDMTMAPVIRITDETYERLKAWAVPLEDRPEDVIRRVLDVADGHRSGSSGAVGPNAQAPAAPAPRRIKGSKRTG